MDSQKESFSTGAQRDARRGKGRYDLIDPLLMERLARLMEYGASHYGPDNWRKGMPLSRCVDSLTRHLNNWRQGITDPDHGDNLAAVIFNAMALMRFEHDIGEGRLPADLDDLPDRRGPLPSAIDSASAERIYVAGPFTAPSTLHRISNVMIAAFTGYCLRCRGHLVHVPHAATCWWHDMLNYDSFLELDFSYLKHWATAIYIIDLSPGATKELQYAKELGLRVYTTLEEVPTVGPVVDRTQSIDYDGWLTEMFDALLQGKKHEEITEYLRQPDVRARLDFGLHVRKAVGDTTATDPRSTGHGCPGDRRASDTPGSGRRFPPYLRITGVAEDLDG